VDVSVEEAGAAELASPGAGGDWAARRRWALAWGGRIAEFGFVQGLAQLLAAVAGLVIVRTLSKEQYAWYAIAFQMQTTCFTLADIGIGLGVSSIGGRVWQDRRRFGELVKTGLTMRRWFGTVSLAVCLPATMWMLHANGADWLTTILLCVVLVAGILPLLEFNIYGVVQLLHGEYRRIQLRDLGVAIARVAMVGVLALTHMSAALAAAVGAIGNWLQLGVTRRWAGDHADLAAPLNDDDRRELRRLSLVSFPNVLFYCFQGQLTLLILTLVGNSTGIADVTALGRLAMLLSVFSVVFAKLMGPRFTRCQNPRRLRAMYGGMTALALALLAPIVLVAWLWPRPLLWLLGGKYMDLEAECVWVVAASCVAMFAGVLWGLNSSRAWIRVQAPLFIPTILVAQLVAAWMLNLRQFHDLLIFNLVSAAAPLPLYALDGWLGLRFAAAEKKAAAHA
jgi:hypothetical protein